MGKIVGVRFKPSGKSYDFDAGAFVVAVGDQVIVETEQGLEIGTVSRPPRSTPEPGEAPPPETEDGWPEPVEGSSEAGDGAWPEPEPAPARLPPPREPLKKIYRMATPEDLLQHEKNLALEKEAHEHCKECIAKLGLPMSLFSVEVTFDNSRMTFFFTSEGRVDFRELVKMLVRHFRMRIELRQIGVRHQARMCGGLGRCGREACCTTFLSNFVPVSVKMAKVQNLSLNPTKISGLCGRLMCCLTYEHDAYQEMRKDFPKIGKLVDTPQGRGKVVRHNVIQGLVSVRLASSEAEFPVSEVKKADPDSPPPEVQAPARERPMPRRRESRAPLTPSSPAPEPEPMPEPEPEEPFPDEAPAPGEPGPEKPREEGAPRPRRSRKTAASAPGNGKARARGTPGKSREGDPRSGVCSL